ncbi:TerC family protein [Paenirhodobacter sp.]|uniref:TerC family protein n=1 Tax=Paenirhodobacter sp. TaxID=1965326 RepID=UPI003B3F1085
MPVTDRAVTLKLPNRAGRVVPLLCALVVIECADVIFAVNSVPAAFTLTTDPFVVPASIFAVLELRALYFALSLLCLAEIHAASGVHRRENVHRGPDGMGETPAGLVAGHHRGDPDGGDRRFASEDAGPRGLQTRGICLI